MNCNVDNIALSSKVFESKLKPYSRSNLTFSYLPQSTDDLDMCLDPADLSTNDKIQFTFAGNI